MTTELLRWIFLIPLLGAFINGFFVKSKTSLVPGLIATAASLASFIVSVLACMELSEARQAGENAYLLDSILTWMSAGHVRVPFTLELNSLSAVMLLVVTGIGTLIHIYSISYMEKDPSAPRFFAYLNLFLVAMLLLVLGSNLALVFLGWEGVGLCSYLLIGFWYKKPENSAAGMKAFLTNRIGDIGFLLAMLVAFWFFHTGDIYLINERVTDSAYLSSGTPTWAWYVFTLGIFWAATAKSAQFPLYVWLPDAMAGPTPVSALIHAATMVTSGIVVICRLWPVFEFVPSTLEIIFWTGMLTAWLAAFIAVTQTDIKKVLAYSTVSQLGFMFVALGAGSPAAALFHVLTHACFKALLFLGAGSVIHGMHDEQEMTEMGALREKMPITHFTFLAGTLAIIGFPLTSGFFSKDMILAKVFVSHGWLGFILLLGAALLTAFYMLRAYTLTFWGAARSEKAKQAHESSPVITTPLVVLAVLSLFIGWIELPEVMGKTTKVSDWVSGAWYSYFPTDHGHMSHAMEWALMGMTSVLSLLVAYFAFQKFQASPTFSLFPKALYRASRAKFFVDEFYQVVLVKPFLCVGKFLVKHIDGTLLNGILHLSFRSFRIKGEVLSLFHTGSIQNYAWHFVFWVSALIGVALVWM